MPMPKRNRSVSRREFVKTLGAGALAAGAGPALLTRRSVYGQAPRKTLKIAQWSHFVPEYDKWFDTVFCKQWGDKNNTTVTVDHINVNELPARAAAEVSAKKGHDLFGFLSPPAAFEPQVLDMTNVYSQV